MKKALLLILFGLLALGAFKYGHAVAVQECEVSSVPFSGKISLPFSRSSHGEHDYTYRCTLVPNVAHTAKIGIAADDKIVSVSLNGRSIDLSHYRRHYGQKELVDWRTGYRFDLPLHDGKNELVIVGHDKGGKFGLRIGQGLGFAAYLFLFIFVVVPIVWGMYQLLFPLLFDGNRFRHVSVSAVWEKMPYLILAVGIALRVFYLVHVPNHMYQHDLKGHIDNIHYYAEWPLEMPQADKSLQFPQQPLYYWLAASVYSVAKATGANEYDALYAVRALSVVLSVLWMVAGLWLIRLYTNRKLIVNLFMAFLALTPSFVFLSAVINNDALNALLGIVALYAVSAYCLRRHRRYFYLAAAAIALAMLTKISSALYAIYFVVVLLVMYREHAPERMIYRRQILLFGLTVLLVFGFALTKAYIPAAGEFRFVNSGLYSGQVIPRFDLGYFLSFHFFDLIGAGQSHVMSLNDIRFSLPTYFYGTMFTGEFDFRKYYEAGTLFLLSAQMIYLGGLVYLVGLGAYVYFYRSLNTLQKLLWVPVVINLLLILKFLLAYWVVCNSDFRYFTPTFGAIGLIFVLGLERLSVRRPGTKKWIAAAATVLAAAEIFWVGKLIAVS